MKPYGSKRSFDTEPRIKSARALVKREGEALVKEQSEGDAWEDCCVDGDDLPNPTVFAVTRDIDWQDDNYATGAAVAFGLMGMAEAIRIFHRRNRLAREQGMTVEKYAETFGRLAASDEAVTVAVDRISRENADLIKALGKK